MLRPNGVPISFKLTLNGKRVPALYHCAWNDDRSVETSRHGSVFAIQKIDRRLPDRPFCITCWQWLPASEAVCPACSSAKNVVNRKRHVHGWIGLQRYLSSTDYGVDFIRNGRKIEIGNRDLFFWRDPESAALELEYPIDDVRQRGRFVGELHLDHCRVTYMKDRFDRTDPAWDEMVGIVRGEGPLQPQKASSLGFSTNESPLFKLYQAFRRSSPPKARVAGGWANVLVVKDNDRAEEMAKKFYESDPEYQTDAKWWELVEEEDTRLLTPSTSAGGAGASGSGATLTGFGAGMLPTGGASGSSSESQPVYPDPTRTPIPSLTRAYLHDSTSLRWDVKAFEVNKDDPLLSDDGRPWFLRKQADGTTEFFVDTAHAVFRSATLTELDALLCELAHKASDFIRNQSNAPEFSRILADLRDRYGGHLKLDPVAISNSTEMLFRSIARTWAQGLDATDANALFKELPSADREAIHHKMATRGLPNPQKAISDGRFFEFAPARTLVNFVLAHPDLFFDGHCWEDAYADLDYVHPAATEEARKRVLQQYEALLLDALWLSEQDPDDIEVASRERILRATLALTLLTPAPSEGPSGDA